MVALAVLTAGSTAAPCWPMSTATTCERSGQAVSSSWTTSAAIRARKAAERTVEGLRNIIGRLVETFMSAEWANLLVIGGDGRDSSQVDTIPLQNQEFRCGMEGGVNYACVVRLV